MEPIIGNDPELNLKENSFIESGKQPLYILDGLIHDKNPISILKPEKIDLIEKLSPENGN